MSASTRFLSPGEILFREGEESRELYLIKSGAVQVFTKDAQGSKVELGVLASDQIVGEMAFIDGSPRSAWAEALEKTELVVLPTQNLEAMLSQQPPWVKALLESLAVRLRQSKQKIQDLSQELALLR